MHKKQILRLFFLFVLLSSCTKTSHQVIINCEENKVGNSIIKWEITPQPEGYVRVYAGDSPYSISENIPVGMAKVEDQKLIIVNNEPTNRQFYSVKFSNDIRVIVASHNININNVQNFRDLGGYLVYPDRKTVKWGQFFRSGELDHIDETGIARLKSLGIKSIIDIRPLEEQQRDKDIDKHFNLYSIPIEIDKKREHLINKIIDQKLNRNQLKEEMKGLYTELVKNNKEQLKTIFSLLLDSKNYPVILEGITGKEEVAVVAFILLRLLGVSESVAITDYMRSNEFIDLSSANTYAAQLSSRGQEALTALLLANKDYINAVIQAIKSDYGSIEAYFIEGLGFASKDIAKLQSTLLEIR